MGERSKVLARAGRRGWSVSPLLGRAACAWRERRRVAFAGGGPFDGLDRWEGGGAASLCGAQLRVRGGRAAEMLARRGGAELTAAGPRDGERGAAQDGVGE